MTTRDELIETLQPILDSCDAQSPGVMADAILARWRLVPVDTSECDHDWECRDLDGGLGHYTKRTCWACGRVETWAWVGQGL